LTLLKNANPCKNKFQEILIIRIINAGITINYLKKTAMAKSKFFDNREKKLIIPALIK
jgi:hypothetical protein